MVRFIFVNKYFAITNKKKFLPAMKTQNDFGVYHQYICIRLLKDRQALNYNFSLCGVKSKAKRNLCNSLPVCKNALD